MANKWTYEHSKVLTAQSKAKTLDKTRCKHNLIYSITMLLPSSRLSCSEWHNLGPFTSCEIKHPHIVQQSMSQGVPTKHVHTVTPTRNKGVAISAPWYVLRQSGVRLEHSVPWENLHWPQGWVTMTWLGILKENKHIKKANNTTI